MAERLNVDTSIFQLKCVRVNLDPGLPVDPLEHAILRYRGLCLIRPNYAWKIQIVGMRFVETPQLTLFNNESRDVNKPLSLPILISARINEDVL